MKTHEVERSVHEELVMVSRVSNNHFSLNLPGLTALFVVRNDFPPKDSFYYQRESIMQRQKVHTGIKNPAS